MEEEVMQIVLNEFGQELKEIKQQQAETTRLLQQLNDKVEAVEIKVKIAIEAQPKSITKQFRVMLFPEHNATEYYKIVFGRIIFWMFIILVATYLFTLSKLAIEEYFIVKQMEAGSLQYKNSWNYLYRNGTKSIKRKMDSAWVKSLK